MRQVSFIGAIVLALCLPCFGQYTSVNEMNLTAGGWNITGSNVTSFTATSTSPNTLDITRMENFATNNNGLNLTFVPMGTNQDTIIDITSETIGNDTGTSWGGFEFYLLTSVNGPAKYSGSPIFLPPSGYTGSTLSPADDVLTYTGSQPNGIVETWGGSTTGDLLRIDAPAGTSFTMKQLPIPGAPVVPEPGSLSVLAVSALLALGRRRAAR
jgi:hypothetical protein